MCCQVSTFKIYPDTKFIDIKNAAFKYWNCIG